MTVYHVCEHMMKHLHMFVYGQAYCTSGTYTTDSKIQKLTHKNLFLVWDIDTEAVCIDTEAVYIDTDVVCIDSTVDTESLYCDTEIEYISSPMNSTPCTCMHQTPSLIYGHVYDGIVHRCNPFAMHWFSENFLDV